MKKKIVDKKKEKGKGKGNKLEGRGEE